LPWLKKDASWTELPSITSKRSLQKSWNRRGEEQPSEDYWCNPHLEANVPGKLIQQRTGHRSLEAPRSYEHTSITQQRAVNAVLASSEDTDY